MKRYFLVVAASLLCQLLSAQTYEQAINLLKENKCNDAIVALKELEKSGKEKAEAALALSMIEIGDAHYPGAFSDFQVFYQNTPNPYPYVYALYNSGIFSSSESAGNDAVAKFFENLLDDPKANCTIKSCAVDYLGNSKIGQNDFKAARRIFDNLHDIKNWSTVGSFENVSGSGFNKESGPLEHPEADYKFTNKTGATVQWFDIPEVRNDRWWDMIYNHQAADAIIYSQTFINSDADREVWLMAGVSGSLKIWLNDYLVGEASEERNTDEDVYCYKVKLQKGVNRLLLQTGSSEIEKNNFMVRLTDMDGNLLTDITSSSRFAPYSKAKPYEVKQKQLFAEKYFEDEVAKAPNNLINQLLLLEVYNHNEKKYEAQKTVAALKKIAPLSTLVSEKAVETASIDDNVIDMTKEKEFIKTNDPESITGLELRYEDAMAKENWEEAQTLLDKRVSLFGEKPITQVELFNILEKKKETEKLYAAVGSAYEKYPDNERIVELQYYLTLAQSKNVKKANDILFGYLKNNYSESAMNLAIEGSLKTGDKTRAISLLKKEAENSPVNAGIYARLAAVYYDMHNYDDALGWIQKALTSCPYSGRYYYSESMIYGDKGDKAKAIDEMRKCVYYSPTNYEAREKLRTLEDKKKLFDYFKQNDVAKLYKDAQENKDYANEEAVILMNDKREIVYPEHGAGEEQVELLVYINSQTAISKYKEYYIQHNPYSQKLIIEKAELLKKDGNKVPAERQSGYVVFSSLGVGDAIHIYYKLENSYEGKLAEHFWNEMYFNSIFPTQTARYSLIVPSDRHFDYKVSNKDLKPEVLAIENDYKIYTWEENNLPKIVPEPMMTEDVSDKLYVSSIPDWSYVANWYSDVSNTKTKADFEVKEKVKELMAGNEHKTDLEKARIIYDYIENNYNYSAVPFLHSAFTPQRASRTMSTKLGDCKDLSTLFVSMTREAGLNSNLILVRTNGSGGDNMPLPCIAFNHCIAQLHADNKDYIVEMTNNHLPFACMGSSIMKANGLYIPRDGGSVNNAQLVKLNTTDRPVNANVRESQLSFSSDQAIIHRVVYKIGAESANLRYYLKDADDDEKVKKLATVVSAEFNKNIKIENLKIEHLKTLNDTLVLDYDIKVDNFSSDIVGMKVFRIPWTDSRLSEQVFALETRKYPIDFEFYTSTPVLSETISIALPAGKKLAEQPKDVTISCPALSYTVKYNVQGDKIIATREIKYLKDEILPEEYEAVKDVVARINQADTKEIALK